MSQFGIYDAIELLQKEQSATEQQFAEARALLRRRIANDLG